MCYIVTMLIFKYCIYQLPSHVATLFSVSNISYYSKLYGKLYTNTSKIPKLTKTRSSPTGSNISQKAVLTHEGL